MNGYLHTLSSSSSLPYKYRHATLHFNKHNPIHTAFTNRLTLHTYLQKNTYAFLFRATTATNRNFLIDFCICVYALLTFFVLNINNFLLLSVHSLTFFIFFLRTNCFEAVVIIIFGWRCVFIMTQMTVKKNKRNA